MQGPQHSDHLEIISHIVFSNISCDSSLFEDDLHVYIFSILFYFFFAKVCWGHVQASSSQLEAFIQA